MSDIPIIGISDMARASRLVLAAFDDDPARYNAVIAEAANHLPELLYALAGYVIRSLIEHEGADRARTRIESHLISVTEYYERELMPPGQR
ncbi:hypothetical protein [Mycobacterium simiae]|uniref:hypothetical protein n=1 Tax=Mycobacterium simiae TaxID=1784 RepID=UPI0004019BF1|nr:hypothetical protein [Mycobacterium simiae]PLV53007.1 hypothetical protein X011_08015 [Mycobacterium tuberculosis variant microti OV254]BBX39270.1 hypothetical protein MSIM_07210 [Mycobacterium simiae]